MNKKYIRITALSLALAAAIGTLTACGGKENESSVPSETDTVQGGGDTVDTSSENESSTSPTTTSATDTTSQSTAATTTAGSSQTSAASQSGEIDNEWAMFLVNNYNPLPDNYSINTSKIQGDYVLDSRAAPYFLDMVAAAKADGVQLYITSSYRTVAYQEGLFNRRKNELIAQGYSEQEAIAETAKYTAFPGKSEHNSGLAVDFWDSYTGLTDAFENTDQAQWLYKNAHKYGFILRYPKNKQGITEIEYEPWHFRFVGVYHATKIYNSGFCLEEYYDSIN